MRFPWKHRSTRFLQYKITNVKFYIVESTTPSYKITTVKFYIVEITTPSYKISNINFYIVEIIRPSFKRTNIKFYIVEPTTPLDNQLQCRLSHLNRKLFLSRPHKPEGLKKILKHPKVTTTRHSSWKINRLKQQE